MKSNQWPKPNETVECPGRVRRLDPAVEETMALYRAWLAYLLARLGERVIRVPVADVTEALRCMRCNVTRDGDDYIIRMADEGREVTPGDSAQR